MILFKKMIMRLPNGTIKGADRMNLDCREKKLILFHCVHFWIYFSMKFAPFILFLLLFFIHLR